MNNFYAHFMGETGPTKLHEMEKKRITLLLEYYNQKYNRTKYASCVHFVERSVHIFITSLSLSFRRLLDLEHEELEAQSKLEDAEHQMRYVGARRPFSIACLQHFQTDQSLYVVSP